MCETRNDSRRVYYSVATTSHHAECKLCNNAVRDGILLVFAAVVVVAGLAFFCKLAFRRLPEQRQAYAVRMWHTMTPHVKLKILINFYMIASKIDSVYEVEYPPGVKRLIAAFRVVVSVGFGGVGSFLECVGARGYVAVLTVYMLTPVALGASMLAISAYNVYMHKQEKDDRAPADSQRGSLRASRRSSVVGLSGVWLSPQGNALLESALPSLLQLAFLAYPLVTNVAVRCRSNSRTRSVTRYYSHAHASRITS